MYTIDEIITSISGKAVRAGLREVESDTVDPQVYLRDAFGAEEVRCHQTIVPVGMLRILQPDIELWRYLRLCGLSAADFHRLMEDRPLIVVRGTGIEGYPLLQGNHRALYARIHGIPELPALVCLLQGEEVGFDFMCAAAAQYAQLDIAFGSHRIDALREAYKRLLSRVVRLGERPWVFRQGKGLFTTRSARYRELRSANSAVSLEIPCISIEDYIRTLQRIWGIRRGDLLLSTGRIYYRGLMLTQRAIEREKLARIARTPALLDAPVVVARTRLLDYLVVGHTRLRARLEAGLRQADAVFLHVEHDGLLRFLDSQLQQADYLSGNEGLRRLNLV